MSARRALVLPLAALLGLALLAGCSDDDGGDDASGSPTTAPASSASTDETASTKPSASSESTESSDPDVAPTETPEVTWDLNAVDHRGSDGERFAYDCPADGTADGSVWGTDVYTDDSSVCTAAVHAGLITAEDGGRVVIEIAPGEDTYTGSEANGVTSLDYGAWDGSFTFPPS